MFFFESFMGISTFVNWCEQMLFWLQHVINQCFSALAAAPLISAEMLYKKKLEHGLLSDLQLR
jgi:hypothetical protein